MGVVCPIWHVSPRGACSGVIWLDIPRDARALLGWTRAAASLPALSRIAPSAPYGTARELIGPKGGVATILSTPVVVSVTHAVDVPARSHLTLDHCRSR
jgi:hypothetical protein